MYDPTIFDNLKVTFENQVYDLDNLDRKITITNRVDRMDFAIMARDFAIQFTLVDQPDVTAAIILEASLKDLAGEILEVPEQKLGCTLFVQFTKHVQSVATQCKQIEHALYSIWENDIQLTQTVSFVFEQGAHCYQDMIEVKFNSKINEEHMGDIVDFIDSVMETLEALNAIKE